MDQAPLGEFWKPVMDLSPQLRVYSFERAGIIELDTFTKLWKPFLSWTLHQYNLSKKKIFSQLFADVRSFTNLFHSDIAYSVYFDDLK